MCRDFLLTLHYDSTAAAALEQLDSKNYDLPYRGGGKKIFRIGAAFSSKTRTIQDWKIS